MMSSDSLPELATIKTSSKKTSTSELSATPKQIEFILSLASSRDFSKNNQALVSLKYVDILRAKNPIARTVATEMISLYLTLPKSSASTTLNPRGVKATDIQVGFYKVGNRVLKAVKSPQTGNMYAKELHTNGWEYLTGGINLLKNNVYTKLTLDEAKELGKIYGFCVACGRTLTDEYSVEAGIGPICADKF